MDFVKWVKVCGSMYLCVDGEFVMVDLWLKFDCFCEYMIELLVVDIVVLLDNEIELWCRFDEMFEFGKGVMYLFVLFDGLYDVMWNDYLIVQVGVVKVLLVKCVCLVCGMSYLELDLWMFLYNSKYGWCMICVGIGVMFMCEQCVVYDDMVFVGDDCGCE